MRVLLTGGHGFIGTHLVRRLLAEGHAVRCLHRRSGRPPALARLEVEVAHGDVRQPAGLARALEGMDQVLHLAGLTSSLTRRAMFATNTRGTANLLAAAAEARFAGRFVLCSSLAAGGSSPDGEPRVEGDPPRPVTWYGESNLAAEAAVLDPRWDFEVTVVRPPAVYGPRDLAFLPIFRSAAKGIAIVPGDPGKRYSMIFADDLAAGLLAAAASPRTAGGVYYATHEEIVTLADLISAAEAAVQRRARRLRLPGSFLRLVGRVTDVVSQVSGRSSVLGSQRMREVSEGNWVCSPAALTAATGWRATVPLTEGFAQTAAWYREKGLLP